MASNLIRALTVAAALAIAPLSASTVTFSGFLNAPASIGADSFAQGGAIATADEDFGTTFGTLTATEDLFAHITATINPFLTAISGGSFSNSIALSYQVNSGAAFDIPLTQTNGTGSGAVPSIFLAENDVLSLFISGLAGRSGNDANFNVVTVGSVPIPAGGALLLTGLAGLIGMRRRRS